MTWLDVEKYLIPALKALYGSDRAEHAFRLERLLDRNEYREITTHTTSANKTIASSYKAELQNLSKAGLHAKTILKIILIRKGLPHEDV